MTGISISVNGEKMDNVVSNMMAATCEGTIMDNIPIIMTLGTPTAPYLGCKKPLDRDATLAYSSLFLGPVLHLLHVFSSGFFVTLAYSSLFSGPLR